MAYFRCGSAGNKRAIYITVYCNSSYQGKTITCTTGSITKSAVCGSNNTVKFTFSNTEVSTLTSTFTISNSLDSNTKTITAHIYGWYATGFYNALVPTMTSNTTPSGVASSSSSASGYEAYKAFDNNSGTASQPSSLVTTGYVQYRFPVAKVVKSIVLNSTIQSSSALGSFKNFEIQGSNNGSTFTTIYIGTHPQDNNDHDYYFEDNNVAYSYIRLNVLDVYINMWAVTKLQCYG